MIVLGIETSCDETAAAVVRRHGDGRAEILSNQVYSQLKDHAPFGGVGNSGMGTYHGEEGFRELSHAKTVFQRHRFFPIGLFYPPYGNLVQRLVLKFFLGEGDPALASRDAATH